MFRILLLFLVLSMNVKAQTFLVVDKKNASYSTGKKIKQDDLIPHGSKVVIEKKGTLRLRMENNWTFTLDEGVYALDSVIRVQMTKPTFHLHDSICTVLKEKKIFNCRFPYKYGNSPTSPYAHPIADDIKIISSKADTLYRWRTSIQADTVTIGWKFPVEYTGHNYILISNVFDEYIGLESTKINHFTFDLLKYGERAILIRIIAEDCRESENHLIKKEAVESNSSNFLFQGTQITSTFAL